MMVNGDTVTHDMLLLCYDDRACDDVTFDASNARSMRVVARGNEALASSSIIASGAGSMDIWCASEENEMGCYDLSIYAPGMGDNIIAPTTVHCEGMGCADDIYFISPDGMIIFFIYLDQKYVIVLCFDT